MKIGTIGYATEQGLGILIKSFHSAGIVNRVLVVHHHKRPNNLFWYRGAPQTPSRPFDLQLARRFVRDLDLLLLFETPFDWTLIDYCRGIGVPTVLMPMYECMPRELPAAPDFFLNPSLLDQQYYPQGSYIPVPVNQGVPWRKRNRAKVFVHNAGHGGLKGRNGTKEFLEAVDLVKSPAKFIIRSQDPIAMHLKNPNVHTSVGSVDFKLLWETGDVFVFPEKFNGLSLPLQEARAAGMLVMCGNRFPMNTWLPTEPLITVKSYVKSCVSGRCNDFEEAVFDPVDIANTIDSWYDQDISEYSEGGAHWSKTASWENLKPFYEKHLKECCEKYHENRLHR